MPHRGAQTLDQMGPTLAELEHDPGVALRGLVARGLERVGLTVLEAHAVHQSLQRLVGGRPLHLDQVGARDLEARV
jgi:hypothetical protein